MKTKILVEAQAPDGNPKGLLRFINVEVRKPIPVCEGKLKKLEVRPFDACDARLVGYQEWAYGSPKVGGSRYLVSDDGISHCFVLASYNSEYQVGFMSHFENPMNAKYAVEKASAIGSDWVVIYGGAEFQASKTTLNAIEGYLSLERQKGMCRGVRKMEVAGRKVLGCPNPHPFALDTGDGSLFVPQNVADKRPVGELHYAGLASPEQTFLDLVRGSSI